MLAQVRSLHITKENDGNYNLKAIMKNDDGFITLNSKIDAPFLQILTAQNDYIRHENSMFQSVILNKSASFHLNANAIVDHKNNNSLFTLEMGKKEKSYIPKKHRKYNKRKTTSK